MEFIKKIRKSISRAAKYPASSEQTSSALSQAKLSTQALSGNIKQSLNRLRSKYMKGDGDDYFSTEALNKLPGLCGLVSALNHDQVIDLLQVPVAFIEANEPVISMREALSLSRERALKRITDIKSGLNTKNGLGVMRQVTTDLVAHQDKKHQRFNMSDLNQFSILLGSSRGGYWAELEAVLPITQKNKLKSIKERIMRGGNGWLKFAKLPALDLVARAKKVDELVAVLKVLSDIKKEVDLYASSLGANESQGFTLNANSSNHKKAAFDSFSASLDQYINTQRMALEKVQENMSLAMLKQLQGGVAAHDLSSDGLAFVRKQVAKEFSGLNLQRNALWNRMLYSLKISLSSDQKPSASSSKSKKKIVDIKTANKAIAAAKSIDDITEAMRTSVIVPLVDQGQSDSVVSQRCKESLKSLTALYRKEFWRLLDSSLIDARRKIASLEAEGNIAAARKIEASIEGKAKAARVIFDRPSVQNANATLDAMSRELSPDVLRLSFRLLANLKGLKAKNQGIFFFLEREAAVAACFLEPKYNSAYKKFILNPLSIEAIDNHARHAADLTHLEDYLAYMRAWLPEDFKNEIDGLGSQAQSSQARSQQRSWFGRFSRRSRQENQPMPSMTPLKKGLFYNDSNDSRNPRPNAGYVTSFKVVTRSSDEGGFLVPESLARYVPVRAPGHQGRFKSSSYIAYQFFIDGSVVGRVREFSLGFDSLIHSLKNGASYQSASPSDPKLSLDSLLARNPLKTGARMPALLDTFSGYSQAIDDGFSHVKRYKKSYWKAKLPFTKIHRLLNHFNLMLQDRKNIRDTIGAELVKSILKDLPKLILLQDSAEYVLTARKVKQLEKIVNQFGSDDDKKRFSTYRNPLMAFPRYKNSDNLLRSKQWLLKVGQSDRKRLNKKRLLDFIDFTGRFAPEEQQVAAKIIYEILSMEKYPVITASSLRNRKRQVVECAQQFELLFAENKKVESKRLLVEVAFYLQSTGDIYDEDACAFLEAVRAQNATWQCELDGLVFSNANDDGWIARRSRLHDLMYRKLNHMIASGYKNGKFNEINAINSYSLKDDHTTPAKTLMPLNYSKESEYKDYLSHLRHLAAHSPAHMARLRNALLDPQTGYLVRIEKAGQAMPWMFSTIISVLGDKSLIPVESESFAAESESAEKVVKKFGSLRLNCIFKNEKKANNANKTYIVPQDIQFIRDNMLVLSGKTSQSRVDRRSVLGGLLEQYTGDKIFCVNFFEAALNNYDDLKKKKSALEGALKRAAEALNCTDTSEGEMIQAAKDKLGYEEEIASLEQKLGRCRAESQAAEKFVAEYGAKRLAWLASHWPPGSVLSKADKDFFARHVGNKLLQKLICKLLAGRHPSLGSGYKFDGTDKASFPLSLVQQIVELSSDDVAAYYAKERLTFLLNERRFRLAGVSGRSGRRAISLKLTPSLGARSDTPDMKFDNDFFRRGDSAALENAMASTSSSFVVASTIVVKSFFRERPSVQRAIESVLEVYFSKLFNHKGMLRRPELYDPFKSLLMLTLFSHFSSCLSEVPSVAWERYCAHRLYDLVAKGEEDDYKNLNLQLSRQESPRSLKAIFSSQVGKKKVRKLLERYLKSLPGGSLSTCAGLSLNQAWHAVASQVFDQVFGPEDALTQSLNRKWFEAVVNASSSVDELIGPYSFDLLAKLKKTPRLFKAFFGDQSRVASLLSLVLNSLEGQRHVITLQAYTLLSEGLLVGLRNPEYAKIFPVTLQRSSGEAALKKAKVAKQLSDLLSIHKYAVNINSHLAPLTFNYKLAFEAYNRLVSDKRSALSSPSISLDRGLWDKGLSLSQTLIKDYFKDIVTCSFSISAVNWCHARQRFLVAFRTHVDQHTPSNAKLIAELKQLEEKAIEIRVIGVKIDTWLRSSGQMQWTLSPVELIEFKRYLSDDGCERWRQRFDYYLRRTYLSQEKRQDIQLLSSFFAGGVNQVKLKKARLFAKNHASQVGFFPQNTLLKHISSSESSNMSIKLVRSLGSHALTAPLNVFSDYSSQKHHKRYSDIKQKLFQTTLPADSANLLSLVTDFGLDLFAKPFKATQAMLLKALSKRFGHITCKLNGQQVNLLEHLFAKNDFTSASKDLTYITNNLAKHLSTIKNKGPSFDQAVSQIDECIMDMFKSHPFLLGKLDKVKALMPKPKSLTKLNFIDLNVAYYAACFQFVAKASKEAQQALLRVLGAEFGVADYLRACDHCCQQANTGLPFLTHFAGELLKVSQGVNENAAKFETRVDELFRDRLGTMIGPKRHIADFIPKALAYISYQVNPYRERSLAEEKNHSLILNKVSDMVAIIETFSSDHRVRMALLGLADQLYMAICANSLTNNVENQSVGSSGSVASKRSILTLFSRKVVKASALEGASTSELLKLNIDVRTGVSLLQSLGKEGQKLAVVCSTHLLPSQQGSQAVSYLVKDSYDQIIKQDADGAKRYAAYLSRVIASFQQRICQVVETKVGFPAADLANLAFSAVTHFPVVGSLSDMTTAQKESLARLPSTPENQNRFRSCFAQSILASPTKGGKASQQATFCSALDILMHLIRLQTNVCTLNSPVDVKVKDTENFYNFLKDLTLDEALSPILIDIKSDLDALNLLDDKKFIAALDVIPEFLPELQSVSSDWQGGSSPDSSAPFFQPLSSSFKIPGITFSSAHSSDDEEENDLLGDFFPTSSN